MKPLLRVVLIADALLLIAFGVLFLLTPWASLYDALQLVRTQPTLVGQAFGFVLIGLGWLAAQAAFEGALTAPVGKVVGHVNWIVGVLMLVWLIGLHNPAMTGFGELVAGALGALMIVLGLGGVRVARTVRRRDRALALEAAAVAKAPGAPVRSEPVSLATPAYVAEPRVAAPARPAPDVMATRATVVPPPSTVGVGTTTAGSVDDTHRARNAARDEAAGSTKPPLHG
ncbi:MAG TPA: hypothetical protein VGG24_18325 [Paraburkholderia sp.]|jgi:predicted lipid-binding transport protein (Tim44 family)